MKSVTTLSPQTLRELAAALEWNSPRAKARRDLSPKAIDELALMLIAGNRPTLGWWRRRLLTSDASRHPATSANHRLSDSESVTYLNTAASVTCCLFARIKKSNREAIEMSRNSSNADYELGNIEFRKLMGTALPTSAGGPRLTSTRADQILPSVPTWLWERWLACGSLHILVGRQGGGKSTFAAWLAAQVTTGRPYPDDLKFHEPSNVAMLSFEEADDRLVARLHAAGADLGHVDVLGDVEDTDDDGRSFHRPWRLPKDCDVLEAFIGEAQTRLLVVDGLGYSITGDSHNYAVIGSALSALAGIAMRTGCAVLGLTHPPKGASDPVTAAIGSTAWTAIPRVVWVLGGDPDADADENRVCRVSKTNYREPENGVGFRIGNYEKYECGFVTEITESTVSAETLMAAVQSDGERTEREEAWAFLKSTLDQGPCDTSEVMKMARNAGFSDSTIKRARKDLGVQSNAHRDGGSGKVVGWKLSLPDQQVAKSLRGPVDPVDPVDVTCIERSTRGSRGPTGSIGSLDEEPWTFERLEREFAS